jgi:hypothetical protein
MVVAEKIALAIVARPRMMKTLGSARRSFAEI